MSSSGQDIPNTAYKPDGLSPATVIRPGRGVGASEDDGGSAGGSKSSTIGHLFPTDSHDGQASLPVGTKLGPYVVESRIGAGGMGAVFRAHDEDLDRTVALKILSPYSNDSSAVKRFENEARAAARLDHDNIARVYAIGEAHNLHYIAFEFVEGKTVRELIREKKCIDPHETINFILQIAVALKHTASAGVVHRDIKPSNLIMTPVGRAKLVDWGLARKSRVENQSNDLTVSGTTLGTFDYISPEQARDPRQVDVRSDIYSLGCTAYHMLTGAAPYAEGTMLQKLLDHQGKAAPDPREKNSKVPSELARIVRKMMASDPEDRYQSPQSLIHDLLALASESGLRPVHPDGLTWENGQSATFASAPGSIIWWWLGAFVMACSVAIVSDYWTANQTDENQWSQSSAISITKFPEDESAYELSGKNPFTSGLPGIRPVFPDGSLLDQDSKNGVGVPSWASPIILGNLPEKNDLMHGEVENSSPVNEKNSSQNESELTSSNVSEKTDVPEKMQFPNPLSVGPIDDNAVFRVLAGNEEIVHSVDLETALNTVNDGGIIEYAPQQGKNIVYRAYQLRVIDKAVTLRTVEGSRLLLQFDVGGTGPSLQLRDREMIQIQGGSLTLSNVDIQVVNSSETTQPWSLFTIEGPGKLRCRQSTVTIDSDYQEDTSMVRLVNSPLKMVLDGAAQKIRGQIEFEECVLRGATDLIDVETSASAALEIRQSMIAIDGALVRYTGDNDMSTTREEWSIRLSQVAGVINGGLLRVDLGMTMPKQAVDFRIRSEDCLFIGPVNEPFIQLVGGEDVDDLQKMLWWDVEHNVYADWNYMIVLRGPESMDTNPTTIDFDTSSQDLPQRVELNPRVLSRPVQFAEMDLRANQWGELQLKIMLESYKISGAPELEFDQYGPDFENLPEPPEIESPPMGKFQPIIFN